MDVSRPSDDLRALCIFEIALRNALAYRDEARRVVLLRCGHSAAVELAMLDNTLDEIARLTAAVATLRRLLAEDEAESV